MAEKCPECKSEMMNTQVRFRFLTFSLVQEWKEFPVLAGICRKCGLVTFHVAIPQQLAEWIDSHKG